MKPPTGPMPPSHPAGGIEECFALASGSERLIAILHRPPPQALVATTAVVIVVGGPQYRVGSHRQFVHLARALAAAGHPVLRFDAAGMGDSSGSPRTFESIGSDIANAIDALLQRLPAVAAVALWGLCDGASASLLYLQRSADPRVAGVVLVNPWVRSEETLAQTHVRHYYLQRLAAPDFWRKLLAGGVRRQALTEAAAAVRRLLRRRPAAIDAFADAALPFQAAMLRGLKAFDGQVLLLQSGRDYTAREFDALVAGDPAWRAALARPNCERVDLADADHTLSDIASRHLAERTTLHWLQRWSTRSQRRPDGRPARQGAARPAPLPQ